MLRLVIGYTTEHRESDPTVLYVGHDADAAQRAVDTSSPSLARVEVADVAHARRARKGNAQPVAVVIVSDTDRPPSMEEARAMLAEIDRLTSTLADERAKRSEELAGIQQEFKRQIEVAADEIRKLQAELTATRNTPIENPPLPAVEEQPVASAEQPVAQEPAAGGAADGPQMLAADTSAGKPAKKKS